MDIQTSQDPVARARELGAEIVAAVDEIERTRRIPEALLGRLHASRLFRMLQVLLLCATVLFTVGARLSGQAAARPAPASMIDVAAMALTPADLEEAGLEGWSISGGRALTPGAVASGLAFERELSGSETQSLVAENGLVEGYELRLQLPGETPDLPARAPGRRGRAQGRADRLRRRQLAHR